MRVKIEDMRDWLRDYYLWKGEIDGKEVTDEEIIETVENWTDALIAEEYVKLKFNDKKS